MVNTFGQKKRGINMEDCLMCTDDGYKVNREGYTLCKQHYEEVKEEGSNTDG